MFLQNHLRAAARLSSLLSVCILLSFHGVVIAQDEVAPSSPRPSPAGQSVEESSPDSQIAGAVKAESDVLIAESNERRQAGLKEIEKERLRQSALAGLQVLSLILGLICIVFLVLIILVVMWARRIRMLTRQPLPEQHPGDPLWYLRKGKSADSSDVAGLAEGGSAHGES